MRSVWWPGSGSGATFLPCRSSTMPPAALAFRAPATCSGLHLSAVGRDLIDLNRLTLAGTIGCVWLTLGDPERTIGDPERTIGATGLHLSALVHARRN